MKDQGSGKILLHGLFVLVFLVGSCRTEEDLNQSLAEAIENGDPGRVEQLLQQGADINYMPDDAFGFSPLHMAAVYGRPEIIKLLAANNADPALFDKNGYTVVHAAVNYKQMECLEAFVPIGVPLDVRGRLCGCPPLFYAVVDNQAEMVELLLANGCDAGFVTEEGDSLLHKAAFYGFAETCGVLMAAGADPLQENDAGETAVDVALKFDEKECLQILTGAEE